jgi:FkbM family methyltransferase
MSLHPSEKPAALALFPYFSKYPEVYDIGSNKGFWSDILIHNVSYMYLVEPNERLLTYTKVKYDYLENIYYWNLAASDKEGESDFFFFTNQNNGLSSILYNQHWVDEGLPMQTGKIKTFRMDCNPKWIDFLKIDVEGADFLVIKGCEQLLKNKHINFIQFENSAHLNIAGHTLQNVIDYVRQFRYDVFHYDGEDFVKYDNQEAENLYIMDAEFTQDWNSEFRKNTKGLKVNFALEIGCFEGMTSRYICDNLLNPGGRMIAVDPLTDEYLPGHEDNGMFVGQFERFTRNTRTYPVELKRKKSSDVWEELKDYRFGLIYVDGDHTFNAVYQDACNAFNVCLQYGHVLFDDYNGYRDETKQGIDKFLNEHKGHYEIVHSGYQLMIKKLSPH